MPHHPKPWKRTRRGKTLWYVQLNGKQYFLGHDHDEALKQYHELLAQGPQPVVKSDDVIAVLDLFLGDAKTNCSEATFEWYKGFLTSFAKSITQSLSVGDLRPIHVTNWLNDQTWNSTTKNGAVKAVKRALRWATDQGVIEVSPVDRMKGPPRSRREETVPTRTFNKMCRSTDDCFRDFITFLWHTGARPQEVCAVEGRHVNGDRIVFPAKESKGKRFPRVIFLDKTASEIIHRLKDSRKKGPLFRNEDGNQWKRNAVRSRFRRMREKFGSFCAYHIRHTFATRALERGVDPITVSILLGHSDASTLARTYQHLAKNPTYMLDQLKKITG